MSQRLTTKTLPNGIRIVIVPDARAATMTALVLVGVGSSYETPKENGLSHFLEHMCFKGTAQRPSSKLITEEIESLGAVTNAFTDREFTGYFIKGNPTHVDTYVDILSDIYQHSMFPQSEVQKEKGVIIEEINMYEDMPQYKVQDILFDLLYPAHAAGRSILGTKESVSACSQADFMSYKERYYTAGNTVIVFSGNVTTAKAVRLAQRYFGALPRSKKNERNDVIEKQTAPAHRLFHKAVDQAHFALAFRSLPLGDKDLMIARMIATIFGRGMSSRLSLLIREELGAAYYVYAQQESYLDHGLFLIAAGIDKGRFAEVLERVMVECSRFKTEPVSTKELNKAKEYAIGTFRLGLELSDDVASFYGSQFVLRQKVKTPEQYITAIRNVTASDIMRVAKVLFTSKRVNLAVVGPYQENDIPTKILQKF